MQIDIPRLRQRIRPLIIPSLLTLLMLYTADQMFTSERSIVTWRIMQTQIAQLKAENDGLRGDVARLERDIARLKPTKDTKGRLHVDDDFLDELARKDLSLTKPGEQVIVTSPSALGTTGK